MNDMHNFSQGKFKMWFVLKYILLWTVISTQTSLAQYKIEKYEQDPVKTPREHPLDFLELKLDVSFDTKNKIVKGKVLHVFTPLRTKVDNFFLDAKECISISGVTLNGQNVEYKRTGEGYTFYPATALSIGNKYALSVTYQSLQPAKGIYFVGWDDSLGLCKKQIWTQGQGIDNRYWIPMYDEMNDKVISELTITFPKEFKVISNGVKAAESLNQDGTKTWKYKMQLPHAPYLIMLAIGQYEIKESKSKSGVTLKYYYYPEHKDRVDHIYKYTEHMVDFFEKETGVPYSWKAPYSQVPLQDYMYGAMENTTATVFGDFYCVDARAFLDRSYVSTNAHELAHQWFGDLITARSATDTWLQESFATHYQMIFDREIYGKDNFDWQRRGAQNQAITASEKDKRAIMHSDAGSARWYPKGAFVIEMMKYIVGRDAFNRVIKYYLEKNAFKNVDTNELLLAFQDVLGVSLNWFFDQWIYKGGEPHYKVSYSEVRSIRNERFTEIKVEQIHEQTEVIGLFKMPIKLEIYYKDGTKDSVTTQIENAYHSIQIPNKNNVDIDFVLFDPGNQVLKQVTFNKYLDELVLQAQKAPNMLDRYDAVIGLKNVEISKKKDVLVSVFYKEKFFAVKSEILSQLSGDTSKICKDLIIAALEDKDVSVRKAAIQYLPTITEELEPRVKKLLKDSSYTIVETVMEKLCNQFPDRRNEYLEITKDEIGNTSRNIRIKWLEIAAQINPNHYKELVNYASASYEFRTRTLAIGALKRLNYLDQRAIAYLANAATHFNSRLSTPANEALAYFASQNAFKKMISNVVLSNSLNAKETSVLKRILK